MSALGAQSVAIRLELQDLTPADEQVATQAGGRHGAPHPQSLACSHASINVAELRAEPIMV